LALEGSDIGKTRAAQALAKMAITINPELAFPGQRCLEVVRPLIKLLHPDRSAFENFEALMALTNLAGVSDSVRKRIIKEEGISNIEQYMFEQLPELRRAGTECICNMVQHEDVIWLYEKPDNDRIKLLVLYCGEDDEDMLLQLAASGTLAQLSDVSEKVCKKIVAEKSFVEIFKQACCAENVEFQFRIFYILRNIAGHGKELATSLVESDLFEVIAAVSRMDLSKERQKSKQLASEIVKIALEHELIKPTIDGINATFDKINIK
jgi:protein unc-45